MATNFDTTVDMLVAGYLENRMIMLAKKSLPWLPDETVTALAEETAAPDTGSK